MRDTTGFETTTQGCVVHAGKKKRSQRVACNPGRGSKRRMLTWPTIRIQNYQKKVSTNINMENDSFKEQGRPPVQSIIVDDGAPPTSSNQITPAVVPQKLQNSKTHRSAWEGPFTVTLHSAREALQKPNPRALRGG